MDSTALGMLQSWALARKQTSALGCQQAGHHLAHAGTLAACGVLRCGQGALSSVPCAILLLTGPSSLGQSQRPHRSFPGSTTQGRGCGLCQAMGHAGGGEAALWAPGSSSHVPHSCVPENSWESQNPSANTEPRARRSMKTSASPSPPPSPQPGQRRMQGFWWMARAAAPAAPSRSGCPGIRALCRETGAEHAWRCGGLRSTRSFVGAARGTETWLFVVYSWAWSMDFGWSAVLPLTPLSLHGPLRPCANPLAPWGGVVACASPTAHPHPICLTCLRLNIYLRIKSWWWSACGFLALPWVSEPSSVGGHL